MILDAYKMWGRCVQNVGFRCVQNVGLDAYKMWGLDAYIKKNLFFLMFFLYLHHSITINNPDDRGNSDKREE